VADADSEAAISVAAGSDDAGAEDNVIVMYIEASEASAAK
jgi:hypothetical protein